MHSDTHMNRYELAHVLAQHLCNSTVRFEICKFHADPTRGIRTDSMLLVEMLFPTQTPPARDLFQTAQALFEGNADPSLCLRSLAAAGDMTICVYFPLPFKSAERFSEAERSLFIRKMAMYKVASHIRSFVDTRTSEALGANVPDPRHPDEIKWEKRLGAIRMFFRSLIPIPKLIPRRSYDEYM